MTIKITAMYAGVWWGCQMERALERGSPWLQTQLLNRGMPAYIVVPESDQDRCSADSRGGSHYETLGEFVV